MDVHGEIERLAGPYLDGALSEEEDQAVFDHFQACEECCARFSPVGEPVPEPLWRSAGFLRAAKVSLIVVAAGLLMTLGAIFRGDVSPAAEGSFDLCRVLPPAKIPRPAEDDPVDALERLRDSVVFSSGGRTLDAAENPFLADPKLIRHADLMMEVEAFETAQARISALAVEEKGFVSGVEIVRQSNGRAGGTLTLRVPPDRFEGLLGRIRDLGTLRHQKVESRDVTKAYLDLEARLGSKEVLVERLKRVLAEAQGTVKELMDVEVQIGKTVEEIEALKGQLKYYDSVVGFSTIVLRLSEREPGPPAEVVETLQAALGVAVGDVESSHAEAQKRLLEAGGQVIEARLTRDAQGTLQATVRAHVEAGMFQDVRRSLQSLGRVTQDTVDRRRVAQGVQGGALRSERAVIDLRLSAWSAETTRQTRLNLEAKEVDAAYQAARRAFEEAGATLTAGGLQTAGGEITGTLTGELDLDRAPALMARLESLGTPKQTETRQSLPGPGAVLERARVELAIAAPGVEVPKESGFVRNVHRTFSGSVAATLWSLDRLIVGFSLALPWLAIGGSGWLLWRRLRRKRAAAEPA